PTKKDPAPVISAEQAAKQLTSRTDGATTKQRHQATHQSSRRRGRRQKSLKRLTHSEKTETTAYPGDGTQHGNGGRILITGRSTATPQWGTEALSDPTERSGPGAPTKPPTKDRTR